MSNEVSSTVNFILRGVEEKRIRAIFGKCLTLKYVSPLRQTVFPALFLFSAFRKAEKKHD